MSSTSLDYRRDVRSIDEFENDLKIAHKIERELVERFAWFVRDRTGFKPYITDNGADNSGKLNATTTTDADFKFNGHPLEVKYNNDKMTRFRLKLNQLTSYVKQNAFILWVNGYQTDSPLFTVVTPDVLREWKRTKERTTFAPWGNKTVVEIDASELEWDKLPG